MISDTEIKLRGFEVLINALGEVQAERFISLVMRESFDYTIWQRKLLEDKSVREISEAAMRLRRDDR
jgi:hypothetical protein